MAGVWTMTGYLKNEGKLLLQGVTKRIDDFHLKDITLEIAPGEYFILLGPSGAGKTVLLETIAGIYSPDQGEIWLGGINITVQPPEKRRFGFVYQDYMLFPHLNVEQNIYFGLRKKRKPGSTLAGMVEHVVSFLKIGHLLNRFPHTLSGGEQQRVALARALAMEPPVLLMDEPLSSLDPQSRESLQQELSELHKITNIPTIHVTHNFEEAYFFADRVGVMDKGRILQTGKPQEIFPRPCSAEVASFVGAENVFYSDLIYKNGKKFVSLGKSILEVTTNLFGRVGYSIRPEHILLSLSPKPGNCLKGRIVSVNSRGLFSKLIVDVGVKINVLSFQEHNTGLTAGKEVYCFIPYWDINIFDNGGYLDEACL
ncbi:MAG: Molybdate/tungstate import ATP-binding protein WtpC [Desulfotomaculum sp. 46_296]|nr:MAG: Molybdate/tungstate import ATP-binding protein WtpC [Desulfotomaculum sp. 46_296]